MTETHTTIADQLSYLAKEFGEHPALIFGDEVVTYAELDRRCTEFGQALDAAGVRPGELVGGLLPNSVEWVVAFLGSAAAGRVFVGLNTWYTGRELRHVLSAARISLLVMSSSFRSHDYAAIVAQALGATSVEAGPDGIRSAEIPSLKSIVALDPGVDLRTATWDEFLKAGEGSTPTPVSPRPQDPALVVYTSGSTAAPKGVVLCHDPLLRNGKHIGDRQHVTEEDRLWLTSPLFFSYGCANALMVVLSHASTLLLQDVFEATSALDFMSRHGATVYYATTNMTYAMLAIQADSPRELSLRTGTAIGTPSQISAAVSLGVEKICNIYGMTETYGNCAVTDADDPLEVRLGSQGKALPDQVIRIFDPETDTEVPAGEPGEIRVGGLVTPGYLNDDERTAEAFDSRGLLKTGDLGRLDADGRLHWLTRIGDIIKTGGVNVSAADVEEVIEADPRIAQVYVVGVPDEVRGEVIAAVIQPAGPGLSVEDVLALCKESLASYKVPRIVSFREAGDFPTTSTGKVSRRELAGQLAAAG
jgi:fatty-acyl-CoA synthase